MKNSEPEPKFKTRCQKKRSKSLEQNSSKIEHRNTGRQVTHKFQDLFHCIYWQIEGHAHHHLYQCHLYAKELFLLFHFLYRE
ncbi:hypothetical protein VULLAG_LOCUS17367 [Vulpes lagopus]